jgi:hypothetical protein
MTTPCAPGMCSRQADCGDLRCPGHPSQPQNRMSLGTHRIALLDGVRIEPVPEPVQDDPDRAYERGQRWILIVVGALFALITYLAAMSAAAN